MKDDRLFDIDAFADLVESQTPGPFKLDREKLKSAYLDGAMTQLQFYYEQQGIELTEDQKRNFEITVKRKMGWI